MHGFVTRVGVPVVLLACVAIEWSQGGNSLPTWTANLATKTGIGTDRLLRILIALQLAAAPVALLSARLSRPIAWACGVALAFSGLAELSAIVNAPGNAAVPPSTWIAPLVGLAIGAGIVATLLKHVPASPQPRLGAWTVLGALALLAVTLATSARLTLEARSAGTIGAGGVETVMLNPEEWVGMSAAQAGIARHVPQLTPLTMEGTKWVVFYSPTCGRCHEVFRAYFAGPQNGEVIAVKVPHAPGDTVLPSDQPEEVECQGCEMLSLPEGKRWVITPPTIVKFENGVVTCATSADYTRCRKGSDETP
jgi:hypothetical protein